MSEKENTTWVEFTQPTLNYAKGDVVELNDEQLEMVDAVVKKRFGKIEGDGGRSRYKKVSAPSAKKADAKVSTVASGTTRRQTAGGRGADKANENKAAKDAAAAAKAVGDVPPAAGAGAVTPPQV
jgi:hypothetical protein